MLVTDGHGDGGLGGCDRHPNRGMQEPGADDVQRCKVFVTIPSAHVPQSGVLAQHHQTTVGVEVLGSGNIDHRPGHRTTDSKLEGASSDTTEVERMHHHAAA